MVSGGAAGKRGNGDMLNRPPEKLVKIRNYIFPEAFRLEALRALTTFLGAADSLTMCVAKLHWPFFHFMPGSAYEEQNFPVSNS